MRPAISKVHVAASDVLFSTRMDLPSEPFHQRLEIQQVAHEDRHVALVRSASTMAIRSWKRGCNSLPPEAFHTSSPRQREGPTASRAGRARCAAPAPVAQGDEVFGVALPEQGSALTSGPPDGQPVVGAVDRVVVGGVHGCMSPGEKSHSPPPGQPTICRTGMIFSHGYATACPRGRMQAWIRHKSPCRLASESGMRSGIRGGTSPCVECCEVLAIYCTSCRATSRQPCCFGPDR